MLCDVSLAESWSRTRFPAFSSMPAAVQSPLLGVSLLSVKELLVSKRGLFTRSVAISSKPGLLPRLRMVLTSVANRFNTRSDTRCPIFCECLGFSFSSAAICSHSYVRGRFAIHSSPISLISLPTNTCGGLTNPPFTGRILIFFTTLRALSSVHRSGSLHTSPGQRRTSRFYDHPSS